MQVLWIMFNGGGSNNGNKCLRVILLSDDGKKINQNAFGKCIIKK